MGFEYLQAHKARIHKLADMVLRIIRLQGSSVTTPGFTYSLLEIVGKSWMISSYGSSWGKVETAKGSFIFSSQTISAFRSISSIKSEAATSKTLEHQNIRQENGSGKLLWIKISRPD